jgi:lysozyme
MPTPVVIDLSHWNAIDQTGFDELKAQGIIGVIHKATENNDYADPTYNPRREMAINSGLLWGAYHFLRPGDMIEQAQWFVEHANGGDDVLLAADHEDSGVTLNDLKLFLIAVENLTGQKAVIYSGNVIKEQVGDNADAMLENHRLWLAHYADEPSWPTAIWNNYWLWQYTDKGSINGVEGDVDLNDYGGGDTQLPDLAGDWQRAVVRIAIAAPRNTQVIITINGETV